MGILYNLLKQQIQFYRGYCKFCNVYPIQQQIQTVKIQQVLSVIYRFTTKHQQ